MSVIKIEDLTKDYGHNKGIFDVTLEVNKGEVLGFLGPNGAGKTTTIRHLMGFSTPDAGTVTINDLDCFKYVEKIQKNVGYLPGEIAFMDDMKGYEFIQFIAKMKGLKDLDYAHELIDYFELDPQGSIKKMSKGMKQKIGIVCAFMQDPDILILDEPTSGLDPLMQNKFVELIKKSKENGKTILMSSHMFEEIEKTCDRVAIIKNGKIVAIDSLESLQEKRKKHFSLTFHNDKDKVKFLKEFDEAFTKNNHVEIITSDFNEIIHHLSQYSLKNIVIKDQSIEDIFLHYYGGSNND